MQRDNQEQLVHFLSDMYSLELQALAQLVRAPDLAEEPRVAANFRQHYEETQQQAEIVRERLEALGGSPSTIKDVIMKLGGKGFLLFAQLMPETPGRLVVHSYSYEALEWAGYDLLICFAQHSGDKTTEQLAQTIRDEEFQMMQRLRADFDLVEQLSHARLHGDDLREHVIRHLVETHAFEVQAKELLSKGESIGEDERLKNLYRKEEDVVDQNAQRLKQRLSELGWHTSSLEDTAMKLGGINWGLFFQAQSDSPAKLAAFVYAVLYLQIGGYEMLLRTSERAEDTATTKLCQSIIDEKLSSADQLAELFGAAVDETLADLAK